jgi:hypothetical protein
MSSVGAPFSGANRDSSNRFKLRILLLTGHPDAEQPHLRRLWQLFEYPETSRPAFVIALLSVLMTLVSIVLFCIETLPVFSTTHCVDGEAPNFADPFFVLETLCTSWFTVEAIVRFIACPSKIDFWKDFKNVIDVLAVVPYYVTLFNVLSTMSCSSAKSSASLSFLRVIRLVRVFKLTKHSVGLQVGCLYSPHSLFSFSPPPLPISLSRTCTLTHVPSIGGQFDFRIDRTQAAPFCG